MQRHLPWVVGATAVFVASFLWHLQPPMRGDTAVLYIAPPGSAQMAASAVPATLAAAQVVNRAARSDKLVSRIIARERARQLGRSLALAQGRGIRPIALSGRSSGGRGSIPVYPLVPEARRPATQLVAFDNAPFPYDGMNPRTGRSFLNHASKGRKAHRTRSGRVYWADRTYSDNRVLLHVPHAFDARKPGVMVVFFHGHGATLERDVWKRQRVPSQITESGMNAVLVAPQFAFDARDSSAGKFWQKGGMKRFLKEASGALADMYGDPASQRDFADMPVIIVAYSGGYLPTAYALARGGISDRVEGVVLLDGLYGELNKFAQWIERDRDAFFVSSYAWSTTRGNNTLKGMLKKRKIQYGTKLPSELKPGSVTIVKAYTRHRDYVTKAWAASPIADVLARIRGVESVDVASVGLGF